MIRTAKDRIKEFTKRQIAVSSSMIAKLHSVNGYWHYEVLLIRETGEKKLLHWVEIWKTKLPLKDKPTGKLVPATIDGKYVIISGKYNGEDPDELFAKAELIVGKWKQGIQIRSPITQ